MWIALALLNIVVTMAQSKRILMFGGNGFIGGAASRALLLAGHDLTLVCRGTWEFDTVTAVRSKVEHIACDRLKPICSRLLQERLTGTRPFDAVMDFSARRLATIKNTYDAVQPFLSGDAFYLYISTDSVYEVSELPDQFDLLREEYAVRPSNAAHRESLNKRDSYGHQKLEIEEFLQQRSQTENEVTTGIDKPGTPFLFLRLPDVIGQRDSTDRWWKYQIWMKYLSNVLPISIPSTYETLKTSYVYVQDIAQLLVNLVEMEADRRAQILNQAYNLGFSEPNTLADLLLEIAKHTGVNDERALKRNCSDGLTYFPSVTRGAVSVARAKRDLAWQPTAFSDAVRNIVTFYDDAFDSFPAQRDDCIGSLLEDIKDDYDYDIAQQAAHILQNVVTKKPKRAKVEL